MSRQDEAHLDPIWFYISIFSTIIIALLTSALLVIIFYERPLEEADTADLREIMEAAQVAEGTHYTAVVSSVDVSDGVIVMDNGHEINAEALTLQPAPGDVLAYVKTFDYDDDRKGTLTRTDDTAFINIEVMARNVTETE